MCCCLGLDQELVAEGDRSSLYDVARALMRLQGFFGSATRLKGKGPAAATVKTLLTRMAQELGPEAPVVGVHVISHLFTKIRVCHCGL